MIIGKQAIGDESNQALLASLFDWPQEEPSSQRSSRKSESITVTLVVDGGFETIKLKLPAIATTETNHAIPRCRTS